MTVIYEPPRQRSSRRVRPWLAGLVVAVLVGIGVVVGISTKEESPTTPPAPTDQGASATSPGIGLARGRVVAGEGGSRSVNGIQVGYPRTGDGAVAAATNYTAAIFGPGMYDRTTRRTIVQTIATPENARALEPYLDNLFPPGVEDKVTMAMLRPAWGAYRLDSYTPDRATVTIWAPTQGAADGVPGISTQWTQLSTSVVWRDGDWKWTGEDRSGPDGPTPTPIDRIPDPVAKARLLGTEASRFLEYANAEH